MALSRCYHQSPLLLENFGRATELRFLNWPICIFLPRVSIFAAAAKTNGGMQIFGPWCSHTHARAAVGEM